MASNSAFTRPPFGLDGGSSSWADDDDMDLPPMPMPASMPKVEETHEDTHHREEPHHEQEHPERDFHDDRGHGRGYDRASPAPRREKNPLPDAPPYKLYVGNLPFRMTEDDLADFLGNVQFILNIRMPRDYESDKPKGFAYVDYDDRDAALQALELDGQVVMSREVRIDVAIEKERKPRNSNSFFTEKRGDRRDYPDRGDRPRRDYDRGDRRDYGDRRPDRRPEYDEPERPKERPKLNLQPRTTSSDQAQSNAPKKSSIFGDAKPRDEAQYLERQKSREMEKKKQAEEEKLAKEAAKNSSPRKQQSPHPQEEQPKKTRAPKDEERDDRHHKNKDTTPRDHHAERDEEQGHHGGSSRGGRGGRRGGGRSGGGRSHERGTERSERGERGAVERGGRRTDLGRGRGGERGDRRDRAEQPGSQKQRSGAQSGTAAATGADNKKPSAGGRFGAADQSAAAKKKYVAKTANKFSLLDDDESDSD